MKDLRKEGYSREGSGGPDADASGAVVVGDSGVSDVIASAVRSVLDEAEQAGFAQIVYWLSWAVNLHGALVAQGGGRSALLDGGIDVKKPAAAAAADRGTLKHFTGQLERIAEDAYRAAYRLAMGDLEALVKRKVRSYWDVEVEGVAVGQDVVDLFERYLGALVQCQMPRSIVNQWVFQALYGFNALVFNSFLENPRLCEASIALQLKFYVSELENWGTQHGSVLYHWRSFRTQLQPVVDFTNLMLLDKANINAAMLRECVPSLNLLQVRFLLELYNEHAKDNADRTPRAVLKEMADLAQMDISVRLSVEKAAIKPDKWFNLGDLTASK